MTEGTVKMNMLVSTFFCTHPQAQQRMPETEHITHLMLVNLRQEIKVKVAGVEGSFEKFLQTAKFEETKLKVIVRLVSGEKNLVIS